MIKCRAIDTLKVSDFKMPKPNPEEIKIFINCFGNLMSNDQIRLLQLMADNIYGFYLKSHNIECKDLSDRKVHTCIFAFEHEKAKGEINIVM